MTMRSNHGLEPSAQQHRCRVPAAHCAAAPAQPEHWAILSRVLALAIMHHDVLSDIRSARHLRQRWPSHKPVGADSL